MKTRKIVAKWFGMGAFVSVPILVMIGSFFYGFAKGVWSGYTGAGQEPALSAPIQLFRVKKPLNDIGPVWSPDLKIWVMTLPPKDGFVNNVNVRVDHIGALSVVEYAQISKVQLEEMDWKLISETLDAKTGTWCAEYTGRLNGVEFHWYMRTTVRKGKAYQATATSCPAQWAGAKTALTECVDSVEPID